VCACSREKGGRGGRMTESLDLILSGRGKAEEGGGGGGGRVGRAMLG